MPLQFRFNCPLQNGLHARPATRLIQELRRHAAEVTLTNERNGNVANALSILALVAADVRKDDACLLEFSGRAAQEARDAIAAFVANDLPACDEPLADGQEQAAAGPPVSLRETGAEWIGGLPICRGIGRGAVVRIDRPDLLTAVAQNSPAAAPAEELARFDQAVGEVRHDLAGRLSGVANGAGREILTAHLAILEDSELHGHIRRELDGGRAAAAAVAHAGQAFADRMRAAGSEYVRERAADVEDVCGQLLEQLTEQPAVREDPVLTGPSVVVADGLTPRQLLGFDPEFLRGVVLEQGGPTSHVAILARSLGVATVTNVRDARARLAAGEQVILDAHLGIVVRRLNARVAAYYDREEAKHATRAQRALLAVQEEVRTRDGFALHVGLNVGLASEVNARAMEVADGVGLLRSELVFSNRDSAPGEDEQLLVYAAAARAARGGAVTIRTFDVGADKPLAYYPLPPEPNPFLGCRGVRSYPDHLDVLRTQLRAIARASAEGPVRLLVPMVSAVEELRWMRTQVAEVQRELAAEGLAFDRDMPIGVMVEVPAVAFALPELCEHADFFSIGTNDLAQYFTASDRCNASVARLGNVRQPAFLRLLESIVSAARARQRPIGMCGDMAGDAANLPLLIGLRLDEISVPAPELPGIKSRVTGLSAAHCRELFEAALAAESAGAVDELLGRFASPAPDQPLIDEDLVICDVDCESKADAIKRLVDALYVAGRCDAPAALEAAIWGREEVHATGMGHGFAIPHCRDRAVASNTVAALRLTRPIEWGAEDGAPVRFLLLLATSAADPGNGHLKVMSQLARRLMHQEFRQRLLSARHAQEIVNQLNEVLDGSVANVSN